MKIIVLVVLCIIVASLAVSGCETKKDGEGEPSPTNTFAPFHLRQGQVTVYIGGKDGEFQVFFDNRDVGVVSTNRPLTLMADEGNRTVKVCCGITCKYEVVTIRFGKPQAVDFSEQLEEDCEFIEPSVRIADYFLSGDQITVTVEFFNPTTRTVTTSAEINCGYTYIESRSNNRVGNSAGGWVFSTLKPGDRVTQILRLRLASGSSYMYEIPTINHVSVV
jgi:hypothetical protein